MFLLRAVAQESVTLPTNQLTEGAQPQVYPHREVYELVEDVVELEKLKAEVAVDLQPDQALSEQVLQETLEGMLRGHQITLAGLQEWL